MIGRIEIDNVENGCHKGIVPKMMSRKFVFLSSFATRFFQCLASFVFPLAQSISSVQMMPEVDLPLFNFFKCNLFLYDH
jgi:hypothetical protein